MHNQILWMQNPDVHMASHELGLPLPERCKFEEFLDFGLYSTFWAFFGWWVGVTKVCGQEFHGYLGLLSLETISSSAQGVLTYI